MKPRIAEIEFAPERVLRHREMTTEQQMARFSQKMPDPRDLPGTISAQLLQIVWLD
jgi:hypothetical protein